VCVCVCMCERVRYLCKRETERKEVAQKKNRFKGSQVCIRCVCIGVGVCVFM